MIVQAQKWGNSLAVRIPRSFALETGITEGCDMEMSLDRGGITLRPVHRRKYGLDELVARITPENLHGETGADGSVGGEAW